MANKTNTILITAVDDPGIAELNRRIESLGSAWAKGATLRSCDRVDGNPAWYRGSKRLTVDICPAGFDCLDLDELVSAIEACDWESPEDLQPFVRSEAHARFREVKLAAGVASPRPGRAWEIAHQSLELTDETSVPRRIYIDLNALDGNRVVVRQYGTIRDLVRLDLEIIDGMRLPFYSDDGDDEGRTDNILVEGALVVERDGGDLVVELDMATLRHESDEPQACPPDGRIFLDRTKALADGRIPMDGFKTLSDMTRYDKRVIREGERLEFYTYGEDGRVAEVSGRVFTEPMKPWRYLVELDGESL